MKTYHADLHIHTALSPCADDAMLPPDIVLAALKKGLDLIAVCDHNSARNARAVRECALQMAGELGDDLIAVIPGIEIASSEEAHLLALFPSIEAAETVGGMLAAGIPEIPPLYGRQCLVNSAGEIIGEEPRMLSMASVYNLRECVELVHEHDGLAIAAHVDRPSFSVVSQLGFIPHDTPFDAIEISAAGKIEGRAALFRSEGFPMLTASDAHSLGEIGLVHTLLQMAAPSFGELSKALRGDEGRSCRFD